MIRGGQSVGDLLLDSKPIPTILRLSVNSVPGNANDGVLILCHQRHIVASCAGPGGHGGRDGMGAGISAVDPVVLKQDGLVVAARSRRRGDGRAETDADFCAALLGCQDQRLVSMLLRPEGAGHIFRILNDAAALVVETEDGRHHICAAL